MWLDFGWVKDRAVRGSGFGGDVARSIGKTGTGKPGGGGKRRQVAALPWRGEGEALRVLLVSSRETRRWVIPKGWPMKDKPDHAAAAQEAYEEAGLVGVIADQAIGEYEYLKKLKSGAARLVKVDVYPLEVTGELQDWPEKGQRTLDWMTPVEAALAVQEPELRALIAHFAGVAMPAEERPAPAKAPTPVRVAFQRLRRRVTALWGRYRR